MSTPSFESHQKSELRFYSIGIAAENKPLGTANLQVIPNERLPMLDGYLTSQASTTQASGVDSSGTAYNAQTTQSNSIQAVWLPLGESNRQTPPDVRRNEEVIIYQYSDSKTFYWTTRNNNISRRKLETVVWAFSGTQDESAAADSTNSYVVTVSTHQGKTSFTTSQANNEAYGYTVEILGTGQFTIKDNIDNQVFIDSTVNRVYLQNADQSSIDIQHDDITVTCNGTFKVTAKNIDLNSEQMVSNTNQNTLNAKQNNMNTETTHNGNINTGPGIDTGTNGTIRSSGDFATTGHMTADSGIETSAEMKAHVVYADEYQNLPPR